MLIRLGTPRHHASLRCVMAPGASHVLSRCTSPHHRSLAVSRRLLTTKSELRPWKRKAFRTLLSYSNERNLATALDDFKAGDEIPFDGMSNLVRPHYPSAIPRTPLYELRPYDYASPLVVEDLTARPARQRVNFNGIPGDVDELLSVFDACVQVGKLDRAALVLKRFAGFGGIPGEDMIELHNQYLHAKLSEIQASPSLGKAEDLHKWYEVEIRGKGIPQTAETVALMLKASLLTTHGSRVDRLVSRYMGMVSDEAGLEVLSMGDILTDRDLATITSICPKYNVLPGEVDAAIGETEGFDVELPLGSTTALPQTTTSSTTAAPEVLSTPQKGMGLKTLKQTLSLFSEIPAGRDISTLSPAERREIQSRLEQDCVTAAVERWRNENQELLKMGLNTSLSSASLSSRLYDWQRALETRLAQEIEKIDLAELSPKKNKEDLDRCLYGPFLRQSSPSRLAAVTILSTLSSLAMHGADKGVPLSMIINQLSKVAEEDIRAQSNAKEKASKRVQARRGGMRRIVAEGGPQMEAEVVEELAATTIPAKPVSEEAPSQPWALAIRAKVGAALLSALIDTARVNVVKENPETKTLLTQVQPAFSHTNQFRKGKKIGMVIPNTALVDLMRREPRADFLARHLPMVVEPEPWSKFDKGGFLEHPTSLVRVKPGEKDQKIYTEAALERGDMDQVLQGLDVLGRTAWNINRPVFDVMLDVWNSGEAVADIPPLNPNISIPPEPDSSEDPMQRRLWIRAVKAAENEKSGLHSVRCFMNFQLEIARAFRDQTFYFPHNIDFRGRAYPVPTYLNHMGADHVRGLMCFAKGRELGESGLRWLKVHLSNVFGFDKASLTDRAQFAMDNMNNILDSANKPLAGNRWWLKAEDPWQCLATCFELKAAMELPDPTKYVSHLPVHQDGTCNGLQHYAALGGDTWGARQVNLLPGDRPADVYSAVADLVKESLAKDLLEDNPFAKALDGKITRKVVKQTVMTNVYGVTFAGAKKQVVKQLDALYPKLSKESGVDSILLASYIATKIFKALSTMFRGAHDIQYWLGEIGGRVCRALTPEQLQRIETDLPATKASKVLKKTTKSKKTSTDELLEQFRSTLVWTTPLRMPVVQPYRKSGTRVISTCLQDLILTTPDRSDPVNRRKQLQAFPPNFIHSLDASHMLLSALECDERGLTFAAVHDSFWTHAADVDTMNGVIRNAFIRIHSDDVIGRLATEFKARYKGSVYLAKVLHGTEAAKQIAAFRKKNKMSLKDELLMEKSRLDLLNSSNPEDVLKGMAMKTPASIFGDLSAEEDLAEPEDMGDIGLGDIPVQELSTADKLQTATSQDVLATLEADSYELMEDEAGLAEQNTEDSEALGEAESEAAAEPLEEHLESMIGMGHFAAQLSKPAPRLKREKSPVQVWLPLTFPAIPEKGDFDVRRLKDSPYFFS